MGSTFVSVGECGFWLRDSLLELWLRLASLHIEDPQESGGVAAKIRDQWLLASRGCFNGCVPIDFGDDIGTAEGKASRSRRHPFASALTPACPGEDQLRCAELARYRGAIRRRHR